MATTNVRLMRVADLQRAAGDDERRAMRDDVAAALRARPTTPPDGVHALWINGCLVLRGGALLGLHAGRRLRRRRTG